MTAHAPGINSILQRSIRLSVPLAFLSRHTSLQKIPNLFSTPSRRITHTEKAGYRLHHWSADEIKTGEKRRHSRIAELQNLDACWTDCSDRTYLNRDRQKRQFLPLQLTVKRMFPPLLLVIFDSPLHPSQHLHHLHLNFSLSSSRHATCMHVFFSIKPPILTCLLLLSHWTVLLSFFQCHCKCFIKHLLVPIWHCSHNRRRETAEGINIKRESHTHTHTHTHK